MQIILYITFCYSNFFLYPAAVDKWTLDIFTNRDTAFPTGVFKVLSPRLLRSIM